MKALVGTTYILFRLFFSLLSMQNIIDFPLTFSFTLCFTVLLDNSWAQTYIQGAFYFWKLLHKGNPAKETGSVFLLLVLHTGAAFYTAPASGGINIAV